MRSVIWIAVALVFGWGTFFYWWSVVLGATTKEVFISILTALMFVVALLFIVSLFWIIHNLRLADRGRRSCSTPYNPFAGKLDGLAGLVVLEDLEAVRASSVILLSSEGGRKTYVSHGGRASTA